MNKRLENTFMLYAKEEYSDILLFLKEELNMDTPSKFHDPFLIEHDGTNDFTLYTRKDSNVINIHLSSKNDINTYPVVLKVLRTNPVCRIVQIMDAESIDVQNKIKDIFNRESGYGFLPSRFREEDPIFETIEEERENMAAVMFKIIMTNQALVLHEDKVSIKDVKNLIALSLDNFISANLHFKKFLYRKYDIKIRDDIN